MCFIIWVLMLILKQKVSDLYPPFENYTTRIAIIVIYMKEAINAPIVESLLSNQDKIPSLL